jgi:hypothetical protein
MSPLTLRPSGERLFFDFPAMKPQLGLVVLVPAATGSSHAATRVLSWPIRDPGL